MQSLLLLLVLVLSPPPAVVALDPLVRANTPPHHRRRTDRLLHGGSATAASPPPLAIGPIGPLLRPVDFGADPTGKSDSTAAFAKAVAAMVARNDSSRTLASGNYDLGGATLDLGGGVYTISSPVAVPSMHANFRITGGTLRASATFPRDRYLVELGTLGFKCAPSDMGASCIEDAGLDHLTLDGGAGGVVGHTGGGVSGYYMAGGIRVSTCMGCNLGPLLYVVHFNVKGIWVQGGHEVMIHRSWVGEHLCEKTRESNALHQFMTVTLSSVIEFAAVFSRW